MSDLDERIKELHGFREMINQCGFDLLRNVLNDRWFSTITESGVVSWQDSSIAYCGEYFAYRWLHEEKQLMYICNTLKGICTELKKEDVIYGKVKQVVSPSWDKNEQQAFELAVLCRLFSDEILVDIDYVVCHGSQKNVDASVRINSEEVLIEVTAFDIYHEYDNLRTGSINIDNNLEALLLKVYRKYSKQLRYSHKPSVLVIQMPKGRFFDSIQGRWALDLVMDVENISGILLLKNYLLTNGLWWENPNAKSPLSKESVSYFQRFVS